MQVKEVMSKEVITVKRSTTLKRLLEIFAKFHIFPLVPVIGEDNLLIGIVSFRNLVNVFQLRQPEILKAVPFLDEGEEDIFKVEFTEEIGSLVVAEDIMENKFITIQEDASLEEAYKLMKLHLKEEFPVVDRFGKLAGMIGIFDIIRYVFRHRGVIK
ncbi:MAG: CBS domain-containing protein [Candidatus Omnitrophica bacterium]|nr:CBS domain-containing protein [Candidatus Omnitrophota bacterium]MDD5352053.1 CBS domain-containing protein [Candidatus Omnitrophota bacterium]MDD5549651.1 CBS domain-containing protein [Candidatus Omnitrophota bacterium]